MRLPKFFTPISAVAVTAGVLTLAIPRTAHAVTAALVQVTNTLANPAISQTTDKAAAQLVQLTGINGYYAAGDGPTLLMGQFNPASDTTGSAPFTVPAGQNLVVTDIDLNFAGVTGDAGILLQNGNITPQSFSQFYQRLDYYNPQGEVNLHYNSGIVFPAGATVGVDFTASNSNAFVVVTMRGYLTAN